ncbi:MAG: hypothetical protein K2J87_05640, partial [Muribaculaceae bacterium]|nr:hypothetical protein [Muribaculaceae bacterium]
MKRFFFHNISWAFLAGLCFLALTLSASASEKYPFTPTSRLSSGHWVKVAVPETGIYEISYQELREMGFTDPSKVGVYGKGGIALPMSFTDGENPLFSDDLQPVGVWHHDDKVFFYGRATEEIAFNPSSAQFERKSLNIYSLEGAYFLSDCDAPMLMAVGNKPDKATTSYYLGFDYIYHEADLHQNTTETGQLFWGEDLMANPSGFTWKLNLPLLDINAKAKLECKAYAADKTTGTMRYGVTQATSGNRSFNVRHPSPASGNKINPEFMHLTNPVISLAIPSTELDLYVKVDNPSGDFINLDYWVFTYGKLLPDFAVSPRPQERLAITAKGTKPGTMTVAQADKVEVFDITDPHNISLLAKEQTGEASQFYFNAPDRFREFIFCNLSKNQKKISGYEIIANSDLHALASQGADFLIITLPRYKDFADRLAELHRQHNGMRVAVATTPEVYNEFSGGIPDPMAYRAMMKMCYEASAGDLKNILLVGKAYGDFRSILSNNGQDDYLIAFQDNRVTSETHAANAMDFYGFADDFTYSSLQNNNMQVGVGILPFFSEEEAENYLRKVEKYLFDEDKASFAGEFLSIGGVGDNHTHDTQAKQLSEYWTSYANPGQNNEVLALDALGETESKRKLMADLDKGKLLTSYFGHGTSFGINSTSDFFQTKDIPSLKNEKSGFMLICACDLSDTDHSKKGFGELVVTGTKFGMLGSVMATRTVWSGQNFELAKLFSTALYADPNKVTDKNNPTKKITMYRQTTPTIGEVFARAKTMSNYTNSLAYLYIGDPALTIPVPLRRISTDSPKEAAPGEIIRIKGTVLTSDSIHLRDTLPIDSYRLPKDAEYTGKVVVKLLSSAKEFLSNDYITNTKATGKQLYIPISDGPFAEYGAEVKGGEFDFQITIPKSAEICEGDTLRLCITSYDPRKDLAASGCTQLKILSRSEDASLDREAPSINIMYDAVADRVAISISDNSSLPADCLVAEIDGESVMPVLLNKSSDGDSHEYAIYTDRLPNGTHQVILSASDLANNTVQRDFQFDKEPPAPTLSLSSDRKAVVEEIAFNIDHLPSTPVILVISDSDGLPVLKKSLEGSHFNWNLKDEAGNKVSPGLYKALVRSADGHALLEYSSHFS